MIFKGTKSMRTGSVIKIVVLNAAIAAVNIAAFGFFHITIDGTNALDTAFGITLILISAVVFIAGNNRLLSYKKKQTQAAKVESLDECVSLLEQNRSKKTFADDINALLEQIKRLKKKKETINDILLQKFSSTEISYAKFEQVIQGACDVFFLNTKSIINRLNAFDQAEYDQILKDNSKKLFSEELYQNRMAIYNEYIAFVKNATEENENILLKLDKVLLEISKYNSLEDGELENMSAMKEIDALIKDAKLFK